ncbi:MAG: hypothetical protein QM767_13075 [Anaeromyxobacter sp.]
MATKIEAVEEPGAAGRADAAVGVSFACLGYLLGGLGGCLILLSRDLAVPRGELAWLSAGFGVALLVVGGGGRAVLHLGAARLLVVGCLGLAAGSALLALAPAVLPAQAGALLIGVGGAGVVLAAPALITGAGVAARLTRVNAASSLAGVGAPVLLGAIDRLTGHGRLALLAPVPALLWLLLRLRRAPLHPLPPELPVSPGVHEHVPPFQVAVRWLAIVAAVCPEFAFLVWGAARLKDSGLSEAGAAAAAVAFPIGMGLGRLAGPRSLGRLSAVGVGVTLAVAGTLLVTAPVGPALVAVGMTAAGLGISALYPVAQARLVETPGLGLRRGSALATVASGVAVLGAPLALEQNRRRDGAAHGLPGRHPGAAGGGPGAAAGEGAAAPGGRHFFLGLAPPLFQSRYQPHSPRTSFS